MRHSFLDRYSRLVSPIHRLPVAFKLPATLALLLCILSVPVALYGVFIAILILLLVVAYLSTIPPLFLLKRMLVLELFVIGITVLSLFQKNGSDVFAALCVRSTLCLFTLVLFSNTTPFSDLLLILRRWGVPGLVITTLSLLYRYLFVFVDEVERMERARTARTFVRRRWVLWRSYATLIGQLFVRSTERAERIYAAMCARGWR